jgi:hypothetical protein
MGEAKEGWMGRIGREGRGFERTKGRRGRDGRGEFNGGGRSK